MIKMQFERVEKNYRHQMNVKSSKIEANFSVHIWILQIISIKYEKL